MGDKYLKKAFDIGDIPKNFDLNAPPKTGFDYLYRVRLETRKCPKVVVSSIDTAKFRDRQTVRVDACNGFICARPGFEPNPVWLEEQLELFIDSKANLSENRDLLKQKFPKKVVPKITKNKEWCQYCLGIEQHDRVYGSELSEALDDNEDAPLSKKSRLSDSNPPLLSIMLYLNQSHVTKLLTYHINWLEEIGFSHSQGQWLYALLVCLEKPLDPDTCSLLRSLSRLCSKLRDELPSSDHEFLKPLNLILSIVAHYFDQKDMSDDFLSKSK